MSFWRRVPTFLPNLPLKLLPLSETQRAAYDTTGFVKELVFKTVPQATKVCEQYGFCLVCCWKPLGSCVYSMCVCFVD